MVTEVNKLNELQLTLLRLFNRPMKDEETLALQRLLVKHYSQLLDTELAALENKKVVVDSDFEKLLSAKS
jgi:hypothetical protein